MPRVPSEFVPQVTPDGGGAMPAFQAPEVVPMRSYQGEQQAEMGKAMTGLGNVVWRIGQIVQDEVNEARLKEADVQLGNAANSILRGQNGYFTAEGKRAENDFAPAESALNDAANGIMDSLDNDAQRAVFGQIAARNLMQWKGAMADHRNREVRKYNINQSISRTEMYADQAVQQYDVTGDSVAFRTDVGTAINSVREAMQMQGIPIGSPQMNDAERKVRMGVTSGIVKRLADGRLYEDALRFIDKEVKDGNLRISDVEQMRTTLLEQRRTQTVDEVATSIKDFGSTDTPSGTGNFRSPVDGGEIRVQRGPSGTSMQYTVSQGTLVRAPANGVVDDAGGGNLYISADDGTKIRLSGLGKELVKAGDRVSRNSVIGLPADGADGTASFSYYMERNGTAFSPELANQLTPNPEAQRPRTLSEALSIADRDIPDQSMRSGVKQAIRRKYQEDAEFADAKRNETMVSAKRWIASQVIANANKPADQRSIVSRQAIADAMGPDAAFLTPKDMDALLESGPTPAFVRMEFAAGRMTPERMAQFVDRIPAADFERMYSAMLDPKYANVSIDQQEFTSMMISAGLKSYIGATPSSAKGQRMILMRERLNDAIGRMQMASGTAFKPEDRKQIMLDIMRLEATETKGWDETVPLMSVMPDEDETAVFTIRDQQVPIADIRRIMQYLTDSRTTPGGENIIAVYDALADLRQQDEDVDSYARDLIMDVRMRGQPLTKDNLIGAWRRQSFGIGTR